MVKSGSGLLNATQQQSWRGLRQEERKKAATSLIVSLEQMALEVASTIDKHETVASAEQNIGIVKLIISTKIESTDINYGLLFQTVYIIVLVLQKFC
jgi:hypothetical protein